jgi:amidohydrolase
MTLPDLRLQEQLLQRMDSVDNIVADVASTLAANPELSNREHQSSDLVARYLEAAGFTVERKVADLETAFHAVLDTNAPGPRIGILAEYDALPEIGHACGHNLVAAGAAGAASGLASMRDELCGQIEVFGTPAEEAPPQGKVVMAERGLFAGFDAVLLMHPGDRSTTGHGALSVGSFEAVYRGKAAHAAKYPDRGISALDGALLAIHGIEMLREHIPDDARVHGIITDGGAAPNVVPDRAALKYYIRAPRYAQMVRIRQRVFDCLNAGALASGATVEVTGLGDLKNKLLVPELDALGRHYLEVAGATGIDDPDARLGSTDVGNVSWEAPTSTLKVQLGDGLDVHTREFAEAAGDERGTVAGQVGARALALTVLHLLTHPSALEAIQAQFEEQRREQAVDA